MDQNSGFILDGVYPASIAVAMMRKYFVVQRSHWILQPFVVKSSF